MNRHVRNASQALRREAMARGVPEPLADKAVGATLRALGGQDAVTYRRMEAYFWAVVRRGAVRSPGGHEVAHRLVLEAVVADLRCAGREDSVIAEELERGWRGRVCDSALEDVAGRLCA